MEGPYEINDTSPKKPVIPKCMAKREVVDKQEPNSAVKRCSVEREQGMNENLLTFTRSPNINLANKSGWAGGGRSA